MNQSLSHKEYYKKHRTRILAACNKYYRTHKIIRNATGRERYQQQKLKGFPLRTRFNQALYWAKKRGLAWTITFEEWKEIITKCCHYCYGSIRHQIGHSLDRKDNLQGYFLNNVVPCCSACNKVKNNILTYEEMIIAMRAVLAYRKNLLHGDKVETL